MSENKLIWVNVLQEGTYTQWFGNMEIDPSVLRYNRVEQKVASFTADHDGRTLLGSVVEHSIKQNRSKKNVLSAAVQKATNSKALEIWGDIEAGVRNGVSIEFGIDEIELLEEDETNFWNSTWGVVSGEFTAFSSVLTPADPTSGFKFSANDDDNDAVYTSKIILTNSEENIKHLLNAARLAYNTNRGNKNMDNNSNDTNVALTDSQVETLSTSVFDKVKSLLNLGKKEDEPVDEPEPATTPTEDTLENNDEGKMSQTYKDKHLQPFNYSEGAELQSRERPVSFEKVVNVHLLNKRARPSATMQQEAALEMREVDKLDAMLGGRYVSELATQGVPILPEWVGMGDFHNRRYIAGKQQAISMETTTSSNIAGARPETIVRPLDSLYQDNGINLSSFCVLQNVPVGQTNNVRFTGTRPATSTPNSEGGSTTYSSINLTATAQNPTENIVAINTTRVGRLSVPNYDEYVRMIIPALMVDGMNSDILTKVVAGATNAVSGKFAPSGTGDAGTKIEEADLKKAFNFVNPHRKSMVGNPMLLLNPKNWMDLATTRISNTAVKLIEGGMYDSLFPVEQIFGNSTIGDDKAVFATWQTVQISAWEIMFVVENPNGIWSSTGVSTSSGLAVASYYMIDVGTQNMISFISA